MKRKFSLFFALAASFIPFSCMQEEMGNEEAYGYLTVAVDDGLKDMIQMKSDSYESLIYRIDVYDSKGNLDASVENHNQVAVEPIELLMDKYDVVATSGNYGTAFNSPCFRGENSVRIYAAQPASVDITCKLSQVKFSVHFPEDEQFKDDFSRYELKVSNGTEALTFSSHPLADDPSYGDFADTAYFLVPADGIMTYTLMLVNKDGAQYSSVAQIEQAAAAEHYHLDFKMGEVEEIDGAIVLDIRLNGEFKERVEHNLNLNFDQTVMPSISHNPVFDPANQIYPLGNTELKELYFEAGRGIRNLVIFHMDSDLLEIGLPQMVDLAHATAEEIQILNELGIMAEAVTEGAVYSEIDLTAFIRDLPISETGCTYTMSFTVIDTYDRYDRCDLDFAIVSNIQAETGAAEPWAKFAILKGLYFSRLMPEGTTFRYRKAGDSQWVEVDRALIVDNSATKTFSYVLGGLENNTYYEFQAISDKDIEEGNSASIVSFKTEENAETVYNLSFDDWVPDPNNNNAWYATDDFKNHLVWDSANEGTANVLGMSLLPTTPEERKDYVIYGKAARMESGELLSNFAAGNLYTGDFGKATLSPLGATLKWGIPFHSRPLALRGWYRYEPQPINRGSHVPQGQPDYCQIQIFLTDWAAPFEINTGEETFVVTSEKNSSILAYGAIVSQDNTTDNTDNPGYKNGYIPFTIPLEYRSTAQPRHIVISCAASRYGDYFTGGLGSTLYVDEFELVYDPAELTAEEFETVMHKIR